MEFTIARTSWRRTATALAVGALALTTAVTGAGPAAAAVGGTPNTAITITSLPFEGFADPNAETPAATDPAGLLVAGACNGGATIYGTSWWKYTAPAASKFVVHGAKLIGGPAVSEPIGTAVVTGDLSSVRSCGTAGEKFTDAGLVSLAGGQTVYFVTYLTEPSDSNLLAPPYLGVYPSSGVAPTNDSVDSPLIIGSLPFTITQDTTLASKTRNGPACYSKFGVGPTVWYSYTATSDQLVDISLTSDYGADFIVHPSNGDGTSSDICGGQQFQATAGVTYLIGVYGTNEIHDSGQVTLTLSAAPVAPTVKITLAANGTVKKKTGVVTLHGTVTCSGTAATDPVTGTLRQVYQRGIHTQDFTGTAVNCTGTATTWTATVAPTTFIYKGKTQVSATVTACNSGGCTTATANRTVTLKVG